MLKSDGSEEATPAPLSTTDPTDLAASNNLQQYLIKVCPPLLFSTPDKYATFEATLRMTESREAITRFCGNSDVSLLLVELTDNEGISFILHNEARI
jgi:hypothetical protein